ncbi:hypothetical protein SGY26_05675 [Lacticaseibacillus paracasei]|nr:hypothetical protein SGY26_05675 [Lacticaseibacillus paracasei]WQG47266.1 hypothetical protein U2Q69_00370 [Lacticaseibacillus casei]
MPKQVTVNMILDKMDLNLMGTAGDFPSNMKQTEPQRGHGDTPIFRN